MDKEDQIAICKAAYKAGFPGNTGMSMCFVDELQRVFPEFDDWRRVFDASQKDAELEKFGVLTTDEQIGGYIRSGHFLCNYEPGRLSVHYPSRAGGGLCTYITGQLAEKYGRQYDNWNFNVYRHRAGLPRLEPQSFTDFADEPGEGSKV